MTTSIRLTSDLIDCPGHGLIVGASDITIDLDGHVIDGTGLDAGVLNNGYDSVTVTGGHIHEFDYGVQLNPGTSQNVVTGLRVENNQEAGIGLVGRRPERARQHDPRQHDLGEQLRRRPLQRHPARRRARQRRSAPTRTTPCTSSRRASR